MDSVKSHETHRSVTNDFVIQEITVARITAFSCSSSTSLIPEGQLKEVQVTFVPAVGCIRGEENWV